MKRIKILAYCVVLLIGTPMNQGKADDPAPNRRKPNIVFIMADDLGWADVGYNGAEFYETPNIDALCRSGMNFDMGYAGAANCMPSRACLMTGMYTPRTKMWQPGKVSKGDPKFMRFLVPNQKNKDGDGNIPSKSSLDPSVTSLAEMLKQVGYKTLHLGKWHLGSGDGQGFDRNDLDGLGAGLKMDHKFYGNEDVAQSLTDATVDYIAKNKDESFFIYLNHWDVHVPINAREEVVEKYKNKLASKKWSQDWDPVYSAMIEAVDTSVGRIRQALKNQGIAENTLLIFTSDNGGFGEVTWNAPLKGSKGGFYEGGIRVPLCMSWPGTIKPESVCETPVTFVDVLPTFAELAAAPLPKNQPIDGVSIVPLMHGKPITERAIFWHYPLYLSGAVQVKPIYGTDRMYWRGTPCSIMRKGDWKLMHFFETGTTELYNIKQDIGETNDLASSHPEMVDEMLKTLKNWQAETNADIPQTLNPDFDPDDVPSGQAKGKKVLQQGGRTVLTKEIFLARQKKWADERGVALDQSKVEALFDMRDKNKDGKLSGNEKWNQGRKAK
jgi:arylsulfatase A-like enzyme